MKQLARNCLFSGLAVVILMILPAGCSQSMDEPGAQGEASRKETRGIANNPYQVSRTDAWNIAFPRKSNKSRAVNSQISDVAYSCIRITDVPVNNLAVADTLAHVFNMPDNGGFVVVSGDKRGCPILAFSDTGSFDPNDKVVKESFVNRLPAYYADVVVPDTTNQIWLAGYELVEVVKPFVDVLLYGWGKFNKYLGQEHPGHIVGCATVAAVTCMAYSQKVYTYKDRTYYFKDLLDIFRRHAIAPSSVSKAQVAGDIVIPDGELDYAYDQFAYLMNEFSKDIGSWFEKGKEVGLAYDYVGYNHLKAIGIEVTDRISFDLNDVINYLKSQHIVHLEGHGHAYITDGVCYLEWPETGSRTDYFLHIDWGWGGNHNGYYQGEVFKSIEGDVSAFAPQKYFAIKRY